MDSKFKGRIQMMENTSKKICVNCTKSFPIFNELKEENKTDFCSRECFIEYTKKQAEGPILLIKKRKEAIEEIMNTGKKQPINSHQLIIECKDCDIKLNFDISQIKNCLKISEAVCTICKQKAIVTIEAVKT